MINLPRWRSGSPSCILHKQACTYGDSPGECQFILHCIYVVKRTTILMVFCWMSHILLFESPSVFHLYYLIQCSCDHRLIILQTFFITHPLLHLEYYPVFCFFQLFCDWQKLFVGMMLTLYHVQLLNWFLEFVYDHELEVANNPSSFCLIVLPALLFYWLCDCSFPIMFCLKTNWKWNNILASYI